MGVDLSVNLFWVQKAERQSSGAFHKAVAKTGRLSPEKKTFFFLGRNYRGRFFDLYKENLTSLKQRDCIIDRHNQQSKKKKDKEKGLRDF